MYDYGRAGDGDGNWVELHGLTSIFGMDYGFMRLDCVQSRFFALPCSYVRMYLDPKIWLAVSHTQSPPPPAARAPGHCKII